VLVLSSWLALRQWYPPLFSLWGKADIYRKWLVGDSMTTRTAWLVFGGAFIVFAMIVLYAGRAHGALIEVTVDTTGIVSNRQFQGLCSTTATTIAKWGDVADTWRGAGSNASQRILESSQHSAEIFKLWVKILTAVAALLGGLVWRYGVSHATVKEDLLRMLGTKPKR
jgi:hypothetical protein